MPNPINLNDLSNLMKKAVRLENIAKSEGNIKKEEKKEVKETRVKIANFKKRKQRIMTEDGYSYM